MKKLFALFCLLAGLAATGFAQTSTQQSATKLDAAVLSQNFSTAAAQGTITITPPAGQFVYIVELDGICVNGTNATLTNGNYTTTGLGGNPKWPASCSATAQAVGSGFVFAPATPYKSASAGTAVTVVTPASLANATWNLNVFYYFAP